MPLILGTNSIKDTGYDVANSLRNDRSSSDYLYQTFSSGNRKTWTWSGWIKRGNALGGDHAIFSTGTYPDLFQFIFNAPDDCLRVLNYESGTDNLDIYTNARYRDVSAWYHIVLAVDTTQATSSNRAKLYVNGNQVTSLQASTYPSQNTDLKINLAQSHSLNARVGHGGDQNLDGYLSEVCFIDGQQLDPTSFGQFDEDSGIWKPINVSGLTFGTNGFYLDFQNSGSLGADVSGNGNNFTVNNLTSIDQTTDTPTNNFCTLNAIVEGQSNVTYSEGNLKASESAGDLPSAKGTIAVSSGKWYWEGLLLGGNGAIAIGTDDMDASSYPHNSSNSGDGWTYHYDGSGRTSTGSNITIGNTYTTNDIIGVALDMDSGTCKFYKNGTEQTTGSWSGLNAYGSILPAFYLDGITWFANFGQEGSFGGNVTAQGNADGNGFGDFYYAPPSGYYALNTKNLAEYG